MIGGTQTSGPGGAPFDIQIGWSLAARRKFEQVEQVWGSLKRFNSMWGGIVELISKGIAEQISAGVTPEGEEWPELSAAYAGHVGRSGMYIPMTSSIWDSYVMNPILYMNETQLIYEPGGIEMYHLSLRLGWITARGNTKVPGREWFGISEQTSQLIDDNMNEYITEKINKGLGGNIESSTETIDLGAGGMFDAAGKLILR
jgi:hypothetical protein